MRRAALCVLAVSSLVACGGSSKTQTATSSAPAAVAEPAPVSEEGSQAGAAEEQPAEPQPKPDPVPEPVEEPAAPAKAAHAVPPQKAAKPQMLVRPIPSQGGVWATHNAGVLSSLGSPTPQGAVLSIKRANGGLSAEETLRVAQLAQSSFDSCAAEMKSFSAKKRSDFSLNFRISPGGVPAKLKATGGDPSVRACFAKLTRRLQFPEHKRATQVTLAIVLHSPFGYGSLGPGGYGLMGSGPGGGGTALGGLGGSGGGYGKTRTGKTPTVRPGNSSVKGALDKDIIRRVIRRHLPQIRHCYEKELQLTPTLAGKVQTSFTIDSHGLVARVTTAGISSAVSQCVRRVLRSMRFPKPAGGGTVTVSYPFTFTSGK